MQKSFKRIKIEIGKNVLLMSPNPLKEYFLATDASDYAIGATLPQKDDKDKERIISFFSRKLSDVQMRYSATDKNF
ncbi:MAG: ribonuclease H family protein [Aeromonas sp.]